MNEQHTSQPHPTAGTRENPIKLRGSAEQIATAIADRVFGPAKGEPAGNVPIVESPWEAKIRKHSTDGTAIQHMPTTSNSGKTPGQVAYEGAKQLGRFLRDWKQLAALEQREWEAAARAVQAIQPEPVGATASDLIADAIATGAVLAEQPQQSGVALIAAERRRQVEAEGWTPANDDTYTSGELAIAGACYAHGLRQDFTTAEPYDRRFSGKRVSIPREWPWLAKWWKPTPDNRVRELVKAGALIAAEIDRLQRAAPPQQPAAGDAKGASDA